MGRPVRQFETNGWLAVATLGLGCCLAATESERYTALWNFGTRGFDELALIAVLLVAAVALLCAAARRGRQACDDVRVVVGVGAVALVGSALRLGGATVPLSPMAILAGSLATQFSSILLVLYAQFFLQVGVKKATIALACAFMVSGMLQVAGAGVPAGFARAATVCFPLLATAALVLAPRLRGGIEAAQDLEDVEIEAEGDAMHLRDGRYAVWCASLFLLNVLLIVLHDQAMALQDGSSLSRLVQACSGLGSAVAGVLFLVIMRSLHGSQLLSLLRILILPVVMLALYASMLAGGLGTAFYLMLLGACYATLLLFIWLLPRRFKDRGTWFPALGVAYVSYRLGWAFGIWRVQLSADGDATAVTVTCFVALVASACSRWCGCSRFQRTRSRRRTARPTGCPTLLPGAARAPSSAAAYHRGSPRCCPSWLRAVTRGISPGSSSSPTARPARISCTSTKSWGSIPSRSLSTWWRGWRGSSVFLVFTRVLTDVRPSLAQFGDAPDQRVSRPARFGDTPPPQTPIA